MSDLKLMRDVWFGKAIEGGKVRRFGVIAVISPGRAQLMLSRNAHNRPLSKPTVARYARAMREGRWRLTPESIAFSSDGNLIDGTDKLTPKDVTKLKALLQGVTMSALLKELH